MPYRFNQWQAAGLGKAPTLEIPTARPPAKLTSARLTPPAILTRSKPVRPSLKPAILKRAEARPKPVKPTPVYTGGKFVLRKPLPSIYRPTEKLTSALPLAVPRPVAAVAPARPVTVYSEKPVSQPVNPAKPVATLTTTARGEAVVEVARPAIAANAAAPLISFDKPVVQVIPKPADPTVTESGAGISPQAQTWMKYGLLAVGAFILYDVFKPKTSVRARRAY